jgi:DNA-binding PadR family transcriptional regulator
VSSIDLVILGFAKKSPIGAYDLAKIVERTDMAKWLKIGLPTIYQNLRKLAEKGCLAADFVANGNLPDRTVYSITAAGEARWLELMERYSSEPGHLYFDFNAFVVNMGLLDPVSRSRMLENLRSHFARQKEGLERATGESRAVPRERRAIIAQYARVYDAILDWVEGCIGNLAGDDGGSA